ncbi:MULTISPECIES: hypothetical protein [Arthrobacter]|uniref:hypothetical protein n=1 Tax=Arthrobacter TaxID=1663 RepID=UPI00160694EA|nr:MULTISPECIES: hypothetical protein [Arthrobacter]QYF89361.1 hypothetical protein KY499_14855 [Arthrobacter sp. PAMC25284]
MDTAGGMLQTYGDNVSSLGIGYDPEENLLTPQDMALVLLESGGRSYAVVIYTWGPDDADSDARIDLIHQLTQEITGALFGL